MQTIGERLEDARKRKGISIREAAEATKIRGDYLQRFEGNQFDLGLAEIYVKGFLRSYAHFLGLPADRVINDFNGLGLGGTSRTRTPSREVYGRMDLTVASVEGKASEADDAPADTPAPVRRHPAAFARGGGNLHQESGMNPALVLKVGMGIAGVIVVLLIIWGIKSMVSDGKAKTPAATANVALLAPEKMVVLTAMSPMSVQVSVQNPDTTPGEILLPNTPLARGEQRSIPWRTALLITSTSWENLQVEVNGKKIPTPFSGFTRAALPAPSP
jgi:transcriptional regulator with XRE-family HTH domain